LRGGEIVAVTDHVEQLGDEFDLSVLALVPRMLRMSASMYC
jgi:hypothetical protein